MKHEEFKFLIHGVANDGDGDRFGRLAGCKGQGAVGLFKVDARRRAVAVSAVAYGDNLVGQRRATEVHVEGQICRSVVAFHDDVTGCSHDGGAIIIDESDVGTGVGEGREILTGHAGEEDLKVLVRFGNGVAVVRNGDLFCCFANGENDCSGGASIVYSSDC